MKMNIDIKTILLKKVLPRGWWICLVATLISHIALLGAGASAVQALDSAAARISSVATRTVATNVQHALPALKNTLYALIALALTNFLAALVYAFTQRRLDGTLHTGDRARYRSRLLQFTLAVCAVLGAWAGEVGLIASVLSRQNNLPQIRARPGQPVRDGDGEWMAALLPVYGAGVVSIFWGFMLWGLGARDRSLAKYWIIRDEKVSFMEMA